jgi:uncharacterized protein
MTEASVTEFYPKDFIETAEGLVFAVVAQGLEFEKVLCFLRYTINEGCWKKYATSEANGFLKQFYPEYLHYSSRLDAHLHAVTVSRIVCHYQPRRRLQQILRAERLDSVELELFQLCELFRQNHLDLTQVGITGSLLIGAQQQTSDIDLICYSRSTFQHCRTLIRQLIEQNDLQPLLENDWQQSYERRSCALNYAEYVWHELRKFNKALINGRKFDLNFIDLNAENRTYNYKKRGPIKLQSEVIDDEQAFDYPATYKLAHPQISEVVSFTATYTGQAFRGEIIEVSGSLEQSELGDFRIVVGATREAEGEYIKVIKSG